MSHGDRVTELPEGFAVLATSENAPFAVAADESRRYYTTMFHPEVVHTPDGAKLLANFVHKIVGLKSDWTMSAYRAEMIRKIRDQVGNGRVLCALSGGVDSSVAAVLIHEAIGDQLTCVFVDHGLMRQNEAEEVVSMFRSTTISRWSMWTLPNSSSRSSPRLRPEVKRKTIGRLFIEVFEAEAAKIAADGKGAPASLAQGTLYPDVIESVSFSGGPSVTIKSHHNVGGLPERMNMKQSWSRCASCSRTRCARWAASLACRNASSAATPSRPRPRHPLPRRRDPREAGHPAQGGRHLSGRNPQGRPLRHHLAGLRRSSAGADSGRDGRLPHLRLRLRPARRDLRGRHDGGLLPLRHVLPRRAATRIINEVRGINRVVYDVTSKPPGTIEWE